MINIGVIVLSIYIALGVQYFADYLSKIKYSHEKILAITMLILLLSPVVPYLVDIRADNPYSTKSGLAYEATSPNTTSVECLAKSENLLAQSSSTFSPASI